MNTDFPFSLLKPGYLIALDVLRQKLMSTMVKMKKIVKIKKGRKKEAGERSITELKGFILHAYVKAKRDTDMSLLQRE